MPSNGKIHLTLANEPEEEQVDDRLFQMALFASPLLLFALIAALYALLARVIMP